MRLPRVEDFSTRVRGPQVTARVGVWLGTTFTICFLTGLWSHYQQTTPGWLSIPASPASLYRVTQGVHVISGTAAVPLLLVKLWSVYPRLFLRPPTKPARALLLHALERLSTLALIAAALFQLVSGLSNIVQWYPWAFSFRSTHYAVGWVVIGALVLHIAVKLPVIRTALGERLETVGDAPSERPAPEGAVEEEIEDEDEGSDVAVPVGAAAPASGISRRGLLRTTWVAAGVAVLLTAGQSVPWLRKVSVFAVRNGDGPQGVPINRTAAAAGVARVDDSWRLEVVYRGAKTQLGLDDLRAMRRVEHDLPIACVEGWSVSGAWGGVPVRDIAAAVGAPARSRVLVRSLQQRGAFGTSELPPQFVADGRTLLALELNGDALTLDHGYPCRIIAPNRAGVRQTKWVTQLEVFA